MTELARPGETVDLYEQVSALIKQARTAVATQANAAFALMNCQIGHLIDTDVLAEQREEIVVTLSRQSMKCHGRGFDRYERRNDEKAPLGLILCTDAPRAVRIAVDGQGWHRSGRVLDCAATARSFSGRTTALRKNESCAAHSDRLGTTRTMNE